MTGPADLLRRIGLDGRPEPTLEGLRVLHRAYVSAIPYEDIAVQLGEAGPLDPAAARRRLLHGGRGGYCFEVNGVLGALLEELGFHVTRHEAVVGPRDSPEPTNHLALVVEVEGERHLADAGYGEGFLDPLPLRPGRHGAPGSPLTWSVEDEPRGGWWIGQHEWGGTPGFRIAAPAVGIEAFAPHHVRLSTSPDSPFVRTLVVQRPSDDRITSLRSRTIGVDGPGRRDRRVLDSPAELAEALDGVFGIDPAALGPARLERLWAGAVAQHEAWLVAGDAGAPVN